MPIFSEFSGGAQTEVRWPLMDLLLPPTQDDLHLQVSGSSPSSYESEEPVQSRVGCHNLLLIYSMN